YNPDTTTLNLTVENIVIVINNSSIDTLQFDIGDTSGAIVGDVVDNAALIFNRSDNITFGGAVSGTGTATKSGANTLIVTGNSIGAVIMTIPAGTFQIGNGGTCGAWSCNISEAGTVIFNRSDSF